MTGQGLPMAVACPVATPKKKKKKKDFTIKFLAKYEPVNKLPAVRFVTALIIKGLATFTPLNVTSGHTSASALDSLVYTTQPSICQGH
jgi:hypothetical protein